MMINLNPVSAVRFRGVETQNNVNDFLSRPGAYSNTTTPEAQPTKKKSHKFLKTVGKLVLTAAVATAATVALRKYLPNVFKLEKTEGLTGFKKYAEYITTPIAKFGEYVKTEGLNLWNKVFNKTPAA